MRQHFLCESSLLFYFHFYHTQQGEFFCTTSSCSAFVKCSKFLPTGICSISTLWVIAMYFVSLGKYIHTQIGVCIAMRFLYCSADCQMKIKFAVTKGLSLAQPLKVLQQFRRLLLQLGFFFCVSVFYLVRLGSLCYYSYSLTPSPQFNLMPALIKFDMNCQLQNLVPLGGSGGLSLLAK